MQAWIYWAVSSAEKPNIWLSKENPGYDSGFVMVVFALNLFIYEDALFDVFLIVLFQVITKLFLLLLFLWFQFFVIDINLINGKSLVMPYLIPKPISGWIRNLLWNHKLYIIIVAVQCQHTVLFWYWISFIRKHVRLKIMKGAMFRWHGCKSMIRQISDQWEILNTKLSYWAEDRDRWR